MIWNRQISQIPRCTCPINHNAPFCNKKCKHVCPFLLQNRALWDICLVYCWICEMDLFACKPNPHHSSLHYNDVLMSPMASKITSLTTVYSTVYSGADRRKHQSFASLAFVRGIHRWPVNSPHKWPVTRKMFPFEDVIMVIKISYDPNIVSIREETNLSMSHGPEIHCQYHGCRWSSATKIQDSHGIGIALRAYSGVSTRKYLTGLYQTLDIVFRVQRWYVEFECSGHIQWQTGKDLGQWFTMDIKGKKLHVLPLNTLLQRFQIFYYLQIQWEADIF